MDLSGLLGKLDGLGLVALILAAAVTGGNSSFPTWNAQHTPVDWMTTNRYHDLYRTGSPHHLALTVWNRFGDEVRAELGVSSKQEFYAWVKENTTRAAEFFKRHGWYIWNPIAAGQPRAAAYYAYAPYNEDWSRTGGDRWDPSNIGVLGAIQPVGGWTFREIYGFLHDGCLFDERLTRLAINYAHTRGACYYGVMFKNLTRYRDSTCFHVLGIRLDPEIYGGNPVILTVYEPKWVLLKGGHIHLQTYGFISEYWLTHDLKTGEELPRSERISIHRIMGGRRLFLIVPREIADKYITYPFPHRSPLNHMQDFIWRTIGEGLAAKIGEHEKFAEEYSALMRDLREYYERKGYDPNLLARWTGIPLDHEMLEMDWLVKEGIPSIIDPVMAYYANGDVPYAHSGREKSQAYARLLYAWMLKYGAWRNEYDHNHWVWEYLAAFYSPEDLEKIPEPGWQLRWGEKTLIDEDWLYRFIDYEAATTTTVTESTTTETEIEVETETETETVTVTSTSEATSTVESTVTEAEVNVHYTTVTHTATTTIHTTSSHELQLVYVDYNYKYNAYQPPMIMAEPTKSDGYNNLLLFIVAIGLFVSPLINRFTNGRHPPVSNQFVFEGCRVEITQLPNGVKTRAVGKPHRSRRRKRTKAAGSLDPFLAA